MVIAVTWSTNSFDQCGVELGKTLALLKSAESACTSTPLTIQPSTARSVIPSSGNSCVSVQARSVIAFRTTPIASRQPS
jgi:hypothetical protein